MATKLDVLVPRENVNDESVTIVHVHLKTGDPVKPTDALIDIETSKLVFTVEAEIDGFIEYCCAQGDEVPVGSLIARIHDSAVSIAASAKKTESGSAVPVDPSLKPSFSEAAKFKIRESGLSEADFIGHDFITVGDIQRKLNPNSPSVRDKKSVGKHEADISKLDVDAVELPLAKRREIEYLSDVALSGLVSSVSVTVNTNKLLGALSERLPSSPSPLLAVITYEISRLLKTQKEFNAFYHNGKMMAYRSVGIGVAVDIDDGLKVVTLKNADTLPLDAVDATLFELVGKYLDKKLETTDVTGSTFTITDLSGEGAASFLPLINHRQSSILAISAIDSALHRVTLTLSFDHRVATGLGAARLLKSLQERLESEDYSPVSFSEPENDPVNAVGSMPEQFVCSHCFKTVDEDAQNNGPGLLRVVGPDGKDRFICQLCWEGW
ncbi:MAG: 2-oxo acid dehydrogenase subunit E2 [Fibrobacterota bacterium]